MHIAFAQERTVTGIVSDNNGLPIPGVNVLVKGTSNGTQNDCDGKFSIKANSRQTLVFSYVGMKTQEITTTRSTVNAQIQYTPQDL